MVFFLYENQIIISSSSSKELRWILVKYKIEFVEGFPRKIVGTTTNPLCGKPSVKYFRGVLSRSLPSRALENGWGGLGGGWRPPPNDEWAAHAFMRFCQVSVYTW